MKKKKVSIKTIADETGFSYNTVSLALQRSPRVRAETAERILAAAQQLGYRPNFLARAMVTGQSKFLGVLIPRVEYSYMPRILQAIHEVTFQKEYGLLFLSHENDPAIISRHLEYLLERRVEGIIVWPPVPPRNAADWRAIEESGTQAVFLENPGHAVGTLLVLDEEEAGRMAVNYLHRLGHRRLARVGPGDEDYFGRQHTRGVLDAAQKLKVASPENWVVEESLAGGNEAGRRWLQTSRRPTGIICFSDVMAAAFVQTLVTAGIRIPDEVSVTGVDDNMIAEAAAVPLTTLRAPAEEMGRSAAELLLSRAADGNQKIPFSWRLIERNSAGPAQ